MTTMTLSLLDAVDRPAVLVGGEDEAVRGRERGESVLPRPAVARGAERGNDVPGGGGPTLDEVVSRVWEGLLADHTAPCPVCAGTLAPRYGAGPGPVAARCTDCGSELS